MIHLGRKEDGAGRLAFFPFQNIISFGLVILSGDLF